MKLYDYILVILTIALLVIIGAISIYGTAYSWLTSLNYPEWTSTWLYRNYLERMNSYAYPFVVGLILVLCMCIPKRVIPREYLLQASGLILGMTIALVLLSGPNVGLGFLLVVSMVIQCVVIGMTLARSKGLVFERQGIWVQLGSAFLHLGFVVFIFDFVLLQNSPAHLAIFWFATGLIILGTSLSFYSKEIGRIFRRQ